MLLEEVKEDVKRRRRGLSFEDRTTFEVVCLPKVKNALKDEHEKWLLRSLHEEAVKVEELAPAAGLAESRPSPIGKLPKDALVRAEAGPAVNWANGNGPERRKAVDAYIEEVFSRTGKRITRTDI